MKVQILILLTFLCSCGQVQNGTSKDKTTEQSIQNNNESKDVFKLDKSIIKPIKDYYQTNFGEGISGKGTRIDETISDSLIEIVYHDKDNEVEMGLIHIWIPIKKIPDLFAANAILEGDLNNDKISDLIISVHTEGGGAGGNNYSQDIFTFISENGTYKLNSVSPDSEFSICDGDFRAKRILDNLLIGTSSCYGPDDARCCPSLYYETKVAFENGKLKLKTPRKQ